MIINIWQCWIKGIWRSLFSLIGSGFPMSGHLYQDIEYHRGCDVIIGRCEVCGKLDTSWSGGRKVDYKEFFNK